MAIPYYRAVLACSLLVFATNTYARGDLFIINGDVYNHPEANAIVVRQGNIIAVGSERELATMVDARSKVIDVQGGAIFPGFIDNHNHVFEAASEAGAQCELSIDAGLEQQIPFLEACRRQAEKGAWVMGYGFSIDAILKDNSQLSPLAVLDSVFPDQPAIMMEQTSHSMWVNSHALDLAGITAITPDPQGGKILKDPQRGEITGILLDNAGDLVMELAWNSLEDQFELSYQGLLNGLAEARAHGITTIGDGRLYWKRGWYQVWQAAQKRDELTARVSLRPWIYPTESIDAQLLFLKQIYSPDKSQRLIVDQVKMYSDGILVNGTAKTLAPYLASYLSDAPYGINYIPPEMMSEWLTALDRVGYGAHIHAIGDSGVRESLDAIAKLRQQGSDKAYTLTHVELVDEADLSRFALLEVSADFQVGSDYVAYHDHQWAKALIGAKRTKALMNLRAMFENDVNVTLSSDWNVHDINPLVGIANSVIMGATGLPNVETAIEAYTINAAKSLGLESITGSIEIGKSADLVVLATDIRDLNPEQIKQTPILMTILEGEVVFDLEEEQ